MHLAHRARGAAVEFVPNRVFAPVTVDSLGLQGGETAYLVDFSGPPGFARALAGAGARVVVLGEPPRCCRLLLLPPCLGVAGARPPACVDEQPAAC